MVVRDNSMAAPFDHREEELLTSLSVGAWVWIPVQSKPLPWPLPQPLLQLSRPFSPQVEDSCVANHLDERRVKAAPEEEEGGKSWSVSESLEGEEEIEVEEGEGPGSGGEDEGEFPDTAFSIVHISGEK